MKSQSSADHLESQPPTHKITRAGLITIILFFGGFTLWSFLFPIESGAVMQGIVVVDTYRKSIQHLEGGIVQKVHVKEGTFVKEKEALLSLDDTQAKSRYLLLEEQDNFLKAKKARLIAERNGQDKIDFPPELKSEIAMIGETVIFNTKKSLFDRKLSILNERISQINNEIASLKAQVISSDRQLTLINEETEAVAGLEAKKLIERPKLLALQREQARLTGNRDENLALIAQAQQKIGEIELQKIQLKTEDEQKGAQDLQDTMNNLTATEEKLVSARDILKRTTVVAPISGTIVDLKTHTVGGVIQPGEVLMSVVPNQDKLVIDARVMPMDIDVMRAGLPAKIQFVALPRRLTPILNGTVSEVSADALVDERTGGTYYRARINVDADELAALGNISIYPGMPVEVLVVTSERTLAGYFIEPIKNSLFKAFRET